MAINIEKMQELFSNEELAKEILNIEKAEDAQAWFSDHGVELTMDELNAFASVLNKIGSGELTEEQLKRAADGEMNEEELAQIAGGADIDGVTIYSCLVGGSVGGVVSGLLIGGCCVLACGW